MMEWMWEARDTKIPLRKFLGRKLINGIGLDGALEVYFCRVEERTDNEHEIALYCLNKDNEEVCLSCIVKGFSVRTIEE